MMGNLNGNEKGAQQKAPFNVTALTDDVTKPVATIKHVGNKSKDKELLIKCFYAILDVLKKNVAMSEIDRWLCSYFVINSYWYQHTQWVNRLLITSPEGGCGKSTLLTVLKSLCPNDEVVQWSCSTAPAIFRTAEAHAK